MGECKRLKAYRELHDIRAQEMADEIGVNINTYCNKENGKSTFTIIEAKKISDRLGKTVDEVFFAHEVAL